MSMPPPPPPSSPLTATQQPLAVSPGPSRKWYLIPLLLVLLVGVPSVLSFVKGLDTITNGLTRVRVPGETPVTLEAGDWTVFYEWRGEFEGESFTGSSEFPGMQAAVFSEDGDEIPVTSATSDFNYNIGNKAGYSVGSFHIDESGEYVFAARHTDPANTQEYVLALGKDIGRATVQLVFGVIGMIVAGAVAFVVWLVIFIVRIRAKRRREAAGYGMSA